MSNERFVIVGASLAGAKAAAELRERGFDGELVLIGAEDELPYERPPLSKDYLRGESERESMRVHDEAFYREQEIQLQLGTRVTSVEVGMQHAELEDGQSLSFDRLLLTTGASPRRLDLPGASLNGIHYLRTIDDSDAIRARIDKGGHVAVIGGGWIGSEIAASARQRGLEVTMIAAQRLPNIQVFGEKIGQFYRDVHASQGVQLVLGDGAAAFEGDGAVDRVRTESGSRRRVRLRRGRRRRSSQRRAGPAGRARSRQRHPRRLEACRARRRPCSPPATWPTAGTRSMSIGCVSSTGPTR